VSNIWIICRKELKGYFASPIAYGLMAFFALIFGYFFYAAVAIFVLRSTDPMMMQRGMPMITMRLFAEEKKSGTIELLATSPVKDIEIIVGKWMAAVLLYGSILLLSTVNLAILFIYGSPEGKPILAAYLGLLLQGACLLAIGTFISNCTKNQIIAGAGTFAVCLLLWVLDWVGAYETSTFGKIISYMSVTGHFENFAKGVIDTRDVVYYGTLTFFGLFLTSRSMESLRWRA
jgi:ABC-2 type transport system permease protein